LLEGGHLLYFAHHVCSTVFVLQRAIATMDRAERPALRAIAWWADGPPGFDVSRTAGMQSHSSFVRVVPAPR